jgi:hypothetical protein
MQTGKELFVLVGIGSSRTRLPCIWHLDMRTRSLEVVPDIEMPWNISNACNTLKSAGNIVMPWNDLLHLEYIPRITKIGTLREYYNTLTSRIRTCQGLGSSINGSQWALIR